MAVKRWRKPNYEGEFPSLGWALIDWCETYLRVPAGETTGQPLRFTDEQVAFTVRAHRIDPVSGRYAYRRAVLRRAKGWGKSPIVGGMAVGHLVGPVVFDGWDANGEPVGRPHPSPWVQVAATAEDQTDNTWAPIMAMLAESPAVDEFGLDVGLTRIFVKGRPGRMEPVTARAPSKEGTPVTFACLDETHLWTPTNGGVKLAAALRRNVGKTNGLTIETTNAHRPGEQTVAESSWEAAQKSAKGLLYDALEGPQLEHLDDRAELLKALEVAYGDSTAFVDLDRLADECTDPATDPADARRFYLNQLVAWEEDAVELAVWDVIGTRAELAPGDTITLGFDGSDSDDSTALVALRPRDMTAFVLGCWSKPEGVRDWKVDRLAVRAKVLEAFDRYRVVRMFCDPPYWQTDIDEWRSLHPKAVERWATFSDTKISEATGRFDALWRSAEIHHDGDARLRAHISAARRLACRGGWRPGKKDTRKIDLLLALLAAVAAHGDALAKGELAEASVSGFYFPSLED